LWTRREDAAAQSAFTVWSGRSAPDVAAGTLRLSGVAGQGETMSSRTLTVDAELEKLQRETFGYCREKAVV
jgi:hypothetical protein